MNGNGRGVRWIGLAAGLGWMGALGCEADGGAALGPAAADAEASGTEVDRSVADASGERNAGAVGGDALPAIAIAIAEGSEAAVGTTLHVHVANLDDLEDEIVQYAWTVEQPAGSVAPLVPSAAAASPSLVGEVTGVYTFGLSAVGASGASYDAVPASIVVMGHLDLHVELVWATPGDPDETDEGAAKGSDVNLHFAHPLAIGTDVDGDGDGDGWFDVPFDAFWYNPSPEWGSPDPGTDDNPQLDRDDTDGGGPENLNLTQLELGAAYRVGVHFWDDHGFGPATAQVRVYFASSLVWESAPTTLRWGDFWEVCSLVQQFGSLNVQPLVTESGAPAIWPDVHPAVP